MGVPEQFDQFILRTIFDLTAKSVSTIYKNVPSYCYPRDVGNFTRWGAALLGLSVFDDKPMQFDLLEGAIGKFNHVGQPNNCQAETYLFSSLAHTFLSCRAREVVDSVDTVYYLIRGRCMIEYAFRKGGIDDLCSVCFPIILKAQKAFLESHKHKDAIKSILVKVSKEEDLELLFKFLRQEALNEKEGYFCGLKSAVNLHRETYDEEFDRADSEEAETSVEAEIYSRAGSEEAESCKKDGFEEAETYNRDGSEIAETYTTDGSNEAETFKKDGFEEAETYNKDGFEVVQTFTTDGSNEAETYKKDGSEEAETYTPDGSDSDGTKSSMEVDKALSDEKTVFQVSSDEEIVDIHEIRWRMRAQMLSFVFELPWFSQGCDVESRMEELYREMLKAEAYSLEQAITELKNVILFVILDQFRRSAEAGSVSADNWTTWGSALLGISIQNGGEGLQAVVEKLDRALSLDGGSGRTDTLCYASCAYGSLYCLTFGSPESQGFLNTAKTYIEKAVCMDPDEHLFTECLGFIVSLEERMVSCNKELPKEKRKYGDAFV